MDVHNVNEVGNVVTLRGLSNVNHENVTKSLKIIIYCFMGLTEKKKDCINRQKIYVDRIRKPNTNHRVIPRGRYLHRYHVYYRLIKNILYQINQ